MILKTKITDPLQPRIQRILRFDRFYADCLRNREVDFETWESSVTERRIFRALEWPQTPGSLSWRLGLDPGYVTRSVKVLEAWGYVSISLGARDRRQRVVELTAAGRKLLAEIRRIDASAARRVLEALPQRQQRRLVRAMAVIEEVLTRDPIADLLEIFREEDEASPGPESPARRAA